MSKQTSENPLKEVQLLNVCFLGGTLDFAVRLEVRKVGVALRAALASYGLNRTMKRVRFRAARAGR